MRQSARGAILALALVIGGCGGGGSSDTEANVAAAAANGEAAGNATALAEAEPALPPCPFRETGDWKASITGGELLVNGRVDIMMAGLAPTLSRRDGSPGAFAFNLALTPEPGAVVDDRVRYEGDGSARHRRVEIHCGGERIAEIDVVLVGG